jgi:hypothetical protein
MDQDAEDDEENSSKALTLRTEVYFCHQNQNAKNIGNVTLTTLLKPHNIGTHLKGTETSFQVVSLF